MSIVKRDEFLKAMDDDYTPEERAHNRKHAKLTDTLFRRMNRLRMQQEGSEWITKGKETCDAIYSSIRQETEWLDLLSESNFMGFEPAKEWEELGEEIEKRDELLSLVGKIRGNLDWQIKDYSFIKELIKQYPPQITKEDHIKKSCLSESFSRSFNSGIAWEETWKSA